MPLCWHCIVLCGLSPKHIQTILCLWRSACFLRRSLTVRQLLLIAIFVGSNIIIAVSSPAEDVWPEFSAIALLPQGFWGESDHRYQMKARDFQDILVIVKQYYWHRCSMDDIIAKRLGFLNTAGRDDLLFPEEEYYQDSDGDWFARSRSPRLRPRCIDNRQHI